MQNVRKIFSSDSRLLFSSWGCFLVGLLVCVGVPQALAQQDTWDQNDTGDWSTNTNWNDGGVPGSGIDTTIIFNRATTTASNQDIATPFALDTLTITDVADGFILSGNSIDFSTAPGTISNNDADNHSIVIQNDLVLTNATTVGGTSTGDILFSGTISGAGGLTINGSGEYELTAANSFTNGVAISGGTLAISSDGNLGDAANGVTLSGTGILEVDGTFDTARTITVNSATQSINVFAGQTLGLTGQVTGTDDLRLGTPGTLRVDNVANDYAGATFITNGGTIQLGASGVLTDTTTVTANGTLDLNGFNETITDLVGAGSGRIDTGDGTLTLTTAASTFAGNILATTGGGGVIDVTGGTWTLSGDNSAFDGTLQASGGGRIAATSTNALTNGTGSITLDNGTLATSGGGITNTTSIAIGAGGGTLDATAGQLTQNATITGDNALTITGGTVQVGAAVASTAITVNAGGTLQLGAADLLANGGTVTANGTLDLNGFNETLTDLAGSGALDTGDATLTLTTAASTFSGNMAATTSGGGVIDVTGGTWTLSGDNSAFDGTLQASGGGTIAATSTNALTNGTGSITLNNGTLATSGGAVTNNTSVALGANGGTLDAAAGQLTQNATITGDNALTITGGTVETGAAVASTDITVDAGGTLQLGTADVLPDAGTVTADGAFALNGNDETIGDLAGGGTVNIADKTLTIAAASSDYTGTFAATATGAGVIDVTGGTLTLSGNSNLFDGTLNVTGGQVDVDGTLGDGTAAFTVANGATAGGAGTWAGTLTVNAGGIVAPGNSIGNMTVATYTPAAGSYLDIEVAGGGGTGAPDNDKLIVTTAANLNGNGTVRAIFTQAIGNYTDGDTWTILDATAGGAGALVGEFAGVTGALGTWSLVYPGDETVDLVLLNVVASYQSLGSTGNQQAAGAALDRIGAGTATGDLATVFTTLNGLQASEFPAALDEITPTNNLQVSQLQLASSRAMTSSLRQHLGVARTRPSGSSTVASRPAPQPKLLEGMGPDLAFYGTSEDAMALGQSSPPPAGETACGDWGLWFRNQSTWGDQEDTAQADGYDFFTNDFTMGGDREWLPGLRAGLMLGYSHTNLDLNNRAGDAELDSLRMAAYGTYMQGGFYVDAAMGFGWNWYENNRNINFIGRKAKSDHDGQEYMAFLGGGYDWTFDRFTVGPTASLQYVHIREDGYSESGAGALNLKVDSSDADFLRQTVGLRAQYDWDLDWFRLTPELRAEWVHEYLTDARSLGATLGYPGGAFTVDGGNIPSDAVNLNAGMRMDFRNGLTGHLFYEYYKECGDGTDAHTISAGMRYEF